MKKRVSFASYTGLFSYGIAVTITGPLIPSIESAFSISSTETGFLIFTMALGFLAALGASFPLTKLFNNKSLTVITQLALSGSLILVSQSWEYHHLLVLFFIIGFSEGLLQLLINSTISTIYPANRSSALSILHLFFGMGAVAGPLLGGYFAGPTWQDAYLFSGLFAIPTSFLFLISVFPVRPQIEKSKDRLMPLFRKGQALVFFFAAVLYVGVEMTVTNWAVVYKLQQTDMTVTAASTLLSWFWGAITVGRIMTALINSYVKPLLFLVILAAGSIVSYACFLTTTHNLESTLSVIAMGIFFSGIFPQLLGTGTDRYPESINSMTILLMLALGTGFLIFPWIVGVMRNYFSIATGMKTLILLPILLFVLSSILLSQKKN